MTCRPAVTAAAAHASCWAWPVAAFRSCTRRVSASTWVSRSPAGCPASQLGARAVWRPARRADAWLQVVLRHALSGWAQRAPDQVHPLPPPVMPPPLTFGSVAGMACRQLLLRACAAVMCLRCRECDARTYSCCSSATKAHPGRGGSRSWRLLTAHVPCRCYSKRTPDQVCGQRARCHSRDLETCCLGAGTLRHWLMHSAPRCDIAHTTAQRSAGRRRGHKAASAASLSTISILPPAHRHPASPGTGSSTSPQSPPSHSTTATMAPALRPSGACIALLQEPGELRSPQAARLGPGAAAWRPCKRGFPL